MNHLFALYSPGMWELLIILIIMLLLFGQRLPDVIRSLGRSVRIFRDELDGGGES